MTHIGIPSSLFYYVYFPMWKVFFEELKNVKVVTSGETTREILDKGVSEALADACVPVKVFFGHVLTLRNKVDYLFIPRIVCLNRKTVYCPKFLGLPDMIRYGLSDMPPIIDVRIDTRKMRSAVYRAFNTVGQILQAKKQNILRAYLKARLAQFKFKRLLRRGWQPPEAMAAVLNGRKSNLPADPPGQLRFAVVGYPYIIHDRYISVDVINKLRRMGVSVVTSDNPPPLALRMQRYDCGKILFWTFSDRTLRAAHYFAKQGKVDGIIHLTAFGCGPDSIVDRFIQYNSSSHHIPFMSLSIDEHSGEAGVSTRLEAFVDMVRRKKGEKMNA